MNCCPSTRYAVSQAVRNTEEALSKHDIASLQFARTQSEKVRDDGSLHASVKLII